MNSMTILALCTVALATVVVAAPGVVPRQTLVVPVHEQQQEDLGPPKPYSFSYAAGRAPGHVDRVHSEIRDESGVVRGEFAYIDPRHRVRTVQYVADANGFHPIVDGGVVKVPVDTPVVAAAKQRHLALKERIAADHARIGAEHARLQAERAALATPEQAQLTYQQQPAAELETPQPYRFSYEAGRYPGHVDRAHSEERDLSGVVKGEYSYVDPRYRVRTVQYVADPVNGFRVQLSNPATDTPAVEAAKRRHLELKQQILAEHARLAAERAALPPQQTLNSQPEYY
ncbi:hypothetical protein B566_EDAN008656 [Ephemera danica]|nr:hypothetical protein B566_EDAN008656 [Ephemera danica]